MMLMMMAAPKISTLLAEQKNGTNGDQSIIERSGQQITLTKFRGDGQFVIAGQKAPIPLTVMAMEDGRPAKGITINFRLIEDPAKGEGTSLSHSEIETNSKGLASADIVLGEKEGKYIIEASVSGASEDTAVFFKLPGKNKNWVFFLITGLLGGLGLFLFGMDMMGNGLRDWAGDQMKTILGALTKHRVYGLVVGMIVTAIIQSSSATTVMLVGFTNAGLMSLRQAIGVILGADIGTTITAQIVAFKLTDYALMFIGAGFILQMVAGKKDNVLYLGKVVLGFGVLFFGLKVMGDVMSPLREFPPFVEMMAKTENPFIAMIASIIFTSVVQSSSATTSLVVALSSQGLITMNAAIPLIFGANIGTCITAALATIGTSSREAKRVAIAHYSFKILGVLLFFFFMKQLASFVQHFSIWTTSATMETVNDPDFLPRQVANAHTIFNVVTALVFLPFTRQIERVIYMIYPEEKTPPQKKFGPKYLDPFLLDIPELALRQARRELLRMFKHTQRMIDDIMTAFRERNIEFVDQAIEVDEKVDILEVSIKDYFTQLAQRKSSETQSKRRIEMFFHADELEKIGDIISKNIMPQISQLVEHKLYFSEDGWKELNRFHGLVSENFERAMEAFRNNDLKAAEEIVRDKQRLIRYYKNLQMAHLERLCAQDNDTSRTSQIHLDILGNLRGVNSHITNIAINMLEHARATGDPNFHLDTEDIEDIEDLGSYEKSVLKSIKHDENDALPDDYDN
jgi:phosphate:Na+ symporter